MEIDRRTLIALAATSGLAAAPLPSSVDGMRDVALWPDGAPGGERPPHLRPEIVERSADPALHDRIARQTVAPLITVFPAARPSGTGLLLIPGGGYKWAVVDKEGVDIARRLAADGITSFVLRYRLPGDGWRERADAPLADAMQAMRLIRARAASFGLDEGRIGVLGGSAGGHLALRLSGEAGRDAAPAFAALLYPVVTMADPFAHAGSRHELLGDAPSPEALARLSGERLVTPANPPTFLVHAMDDASVPVENSLVLIDALRRARVPVEAHLFEEGGHGFGLRLVTDKPAGAWPTLLTTWLRRRKLLA